MLAKEIMRKDVVSAPPEMTLKELAKLLIERQISGVPVIDGQGRLVGVVSQTDLVRRHRETPVEVEVPGYYVEGDRTVLTSGLKIEEPDYTKVSDIMTPAVFSAREDAPVEDLARFMLSKHIHRVIIVGAGRVRGIVTSMDMLRALLVEAKKPRRSAGPRR